MGSFTYPRAFLLALACAAIGCGDDGTTIDPTGCTSNANCPAATPVCDTSTKLCVQCLGPDQTSMCSGATPACGDDNTCRACTANAECRDSDLCLSDGACADPAEIAYVQAGGTGPAPCERGAACGS